MTKFNPENKKHLTYGEVLDPIFKITDKQDAIQYKKDYISFVQKLIDRGEIKEDYSAEYIVNTNIGYYAGYGSVEDRKRIENLFDCKHPIL